MPRKSRIISSSGIYHTILRSINQHIIFEEDADYQKFLFILSDSKTKHDIDIFAYCLMDNHVHILLHALPDDLPSFFRSIGSSFVHWYNSKYSRTGHLFQGRYFSVTIDSTRSYINVLNYIHNNPVKANMCRCPSEYRWSSFNAFYGQNNPLLNVSFSYDVAGSKETLLRYFANDNNTDFEGVSDYPPVKHFFTDEQALEIFRKITGLNSTSETATLNKPKRNEYVCLLNHNNLTNKH